MENVLKQTRRSTFNFEGHAIVTEKTFTINKSNEAGTWVYNSINMGIDCGDNGINYVNLMGGYNPKGNNYLQLLVTDENGKLLPREQGLKIDFEDRLDIDSKSLEEQNVSKSNYFYMYIEKDVEGKNIQKTFLHAYDVVMYLKEHITDKTPVSVKGHIEYRVSTTGEVSLSHVIDTVTVRAEDKLFPKASLQLMCLVDANTIGKKDDKENIVPLYVKTIAYIGKMNGKKYNQTCALPLKLVYDMNLTDITTEKGKNDFEYGFKTFFSPSKKGFIDELLFNCHYSGGVKKTEVKLEDLPKEVREGIEHGFISMDQVSGVAINGPVPKNIIFDAIVTEIKPAAEGDASGINVKPVIERQKYKEEDLISFEDLVPEEQKNVAPVDTTLQYSDEELDAEQSNIMNLFASLGN